MLSDPFLEVSETPCSRAVDFVRFAKVALTYREHPFFSFIFETDCQVLLMPSQARHGFYGIAVVL